MEWPKLNYSEWRPTYETLHRWLQIVGKLRLCKSPFSNHSWNTTFYVTSRGLTTSAIPLGDRNLTIDFDFLDHQLIFLDSLGKNFVMLLQNETVASFFERFQEGLRIMDVNPTFDPSPNEVMDATPFSEDQTHSTYNPRQAYECWQVLVRVANIMMEFRSEFMGKSSPVHLFWGSFDLAVTRFSGRRAPKHPGGIPHLSDDVVREAYSHEVMSCGFWPGNEMYPEAAFYAYAYPEPHGFSKAQFQVNEAFYHPDLHEFILPYEALRTSPEPRQVLLDFFNSAYRAASNLGNWDKSNLEMGRELLRMRELNQSSSGAEATRQ
jgi:hypothetical protein